ncbi:efflux RND transporter permease subunit [Sandaracinobacteroides hominis]|uniref:efflux RND transporter permease subunit n=1 Tax=Sandaracinobacteroides hominis TaxID=2780086 RepID=UPI0018F4692F|nr:efflux RND transporter permease subunit [Sandaracinobacteroides hominis]
MKGLVSFAVHRWQATLVVFALVAALGAQAFFSIPRSVDPQFIAPIVQVIAVLPGADPADIEQTVVKPVEEALAGLDNITKLRSTSTDGQAVVVAEFSWESDPNGNYDEAVREVNAIRNTLPAGIQRMEYRRFRTSDSSVVQYAIVSETASWRRMEKVGKDLKELFQRQKGVRNAVVWGVPKPEIRVSADLGRMAELGIPVTQLTDALRLGGTDLPPGPMRSGEQRFNLRAGGAFRDLAEVRAVPLRAEGERVVRVGDVATVSWQTVEQSHAARFNGKRAIWVTATQKDGVNVLDVQRRLTEAADGYAKVLPPDMKMKLAFDQSDDVRRKLSLLARDFAIALGLVLITLLPLGPRASAVVMVSVPLSLAIGVMVMWWLGYSLNQLVITGFILSLGILVDDSIVVVENISRHLRMGYSRTAAALAGTQQIAIAVLGCTAVLIFAFLPLTALPEGGGKFTRGLPIAVIATVTASLLVSLTIIPFLSSRLLSREVKPEGNKVLQAVEAGIHRFYAPVLHWALERPRLAFWGAMALCVAALGLVPVLGTSLFPPADTPYLVVEVEGSEGADLSATDRAVRFVAETLKAEPEVRDTMENVGRGNPQIFYNVRETAQKSNYGTVAATLTGWDQKDTPALIERLRARFATYPEARITLEPFKNGAPIDAPVQWFISGPDLRVLKTLSEEGEARMRATPGTRDVRNPMSFDRIDLDLGLDSDKAALLGVSPAAARRVTRLALGGEAAGRFRDDEGDSYDVMVRLDSGDSRPGVGPSKDRPLGALQSVDALGQIYVPSASGAAVPLEAISEPRLSSGPASIYRYGQQRSVSLTSNVAEGFLTSKVNEAVGARLKAMELPRGYSLTQGGEAQAQTESFGGMGGVALLAMFGIFCILVLEFGRFRETIVVAGVIPLGMFGGLITLFLTGNSISYTAVIGFVALIGIEIKNSILLVDFTTQLRQRGMELRPAIERAGEVRFLPVLLTSVTAVLALLPLALSGSGLYSPLAWVIIGGLISSTILSRVVTPVMYLLLVRHAPPLERVSEAPPPLPEN